VFESTVEPARNLATRWHLPAVFRILLLLAVGLGLAGQELSIAFLMNLAMVCFGLLLILLGLEEIITRLSAYQIEGWGSSQAVETYEALAAQLWGLIFAALGVMIIVVPLTNWIAPASGPGMWTDLLNGKSAAGLVLGTVGAMATLNGLISILGGGSTGAGTGRLATLSSLLNRLGGTVTFVFGLGMSAVALILLMAPDVVEAIVRRLASMIVP
jgi:hypothetical protein